MSTPRPRRHVTEVSNDRLVTNWLGFIASQAIVGLVILASQDRPIDTTTLVALIGVATGAVSGLVARRTRLGAEAPNPAGTPPPYTGS